MSRDVVVRLVTITLDSRDGRAVAIFEDEQRRCLPLWVEDADAAALAAAARGDHRTTSSAAALLVAAVDACGGAVDRSVLQRVQGGVLRAVVVVVGAAGLAELPARASTAATVAMLAGAPILVDETVLALLHRRLLDAAAQSSAGMDSAVDEPLAQTTAERWNSLLQRLADKVHDDDRPS